jgi:hypothetical protein
MYWRMAEVKVERLGNRSFQSSRQEVRVASKELYLLYFSFKIFSVAMDLE